ncbi:hypothetical protein HAX54_019073 [Datura stramonium]|uniref:Putative plant transposon protein domain-containing protein n=1 Tax=Datura stramonium TaxID=4076 RepID=A0ABS8UPI4_DATST|nr:hypothetical protein [Datura stramonium]
MAPKPSKGKGEDSSYHESKRSKRASEEDRDDLTRTYPYSHLSREARVWLKIVYACLVPGKHVTHITRKRVCIVYALMIGVPVNVKVIIKNVLRRVRVKKGQSFGFGGLLIQFLCGHQIKEEEADYKPGYDPMGIDVTKPKEPEGVHGPVLYVNERNAQINNMLSHLLRMNGVTEKQLNIDYPLREHSRALCRVGPGFEEPLDDDVATEDEMAKVDFDIESSDAKEEDSEMGEAAFSPTGNED